MAAQYELLSQLLKSGGRLDMGQELFYKFYQAFVLKDRWLQYIGGVGTTLLVTAIALAWASCWAAWWRWCVWPTTSSVPAAATRCWGSLTPCARCTPP